MLYNYDYIVIYAYILHMYICIYNIQYISTYDNMYIYIYIYIYIYLYIMIRQRNTQEVKEHEKCPPSQTKEEEIGNLSEKEFRIMIIKMIQNLENKMELQINSLETKIEKMQEMFNKDLEEIKKSQLKMNNAINEIKNTLEGTNHRIVEA